MNFSIDNIEENFNRKDFVNNFHKKEMIYFTIINAFMIKLDIKRQKG